MERRRRIVLFGVLCGVVAFGAFVITVGDRSREEEPGGFRDPAPAGHPALELPPKPRPPNGSRGEDRATEEAPPTLAVIDASRAGRAEVRPTVDGFLRAYLDYEVGQTGRRIRRTLRATATPAFARELVSTPVRPPLGVETPRRARVVRVEIYLSPAAPRGTATAVLERGGERHRATFLLRRDAHGWRVAGLP
jgi:hypothetical protein